jgi:glycosyltransferase involved in cell wall biosynthesis
MKSSMVSAVIPAYNAEAHIARAILSVRASGIEQVIVVDDGSTDGTGAVAEGLGCAVLRQNNQGAAHARIAGLSATRTELVVFLDADDELVPQGLGELLDRMRDNAEWSGVHGLSLCVASDHSNKYMGGWSEGINLVSLLNRGICPGPAGSFIWRAEALRLAIGSNVPALWPRFGEDYEMLLRVAMKGQIGQEPTILCKYTLSGGKSAVSPFRDNVAAERIRRHYAEINGIDTRKRGLNEIKSMGHLRDAYALPVNSNFILKIRHILTAVLLTPLLFPRLVLRRIRRSWNFWRLRF